MPCTGQVLAGHRTGFVDDILQTAGRDDLAAMHAGAGADIDDIIRRPDGILIMLDNNQRVADIPQPLEGREQLVVVPLMQADGRLVEDIQHPDQTGPNLSRQPDALALAARQSRR